MHKKKHIPGVTSSFLSLAIHSAVLAAGLSLPLIESGRSSISNLASRSLEQRKESSQFVPYSVPDVSNSIERIRLGAGFSSNESTSFAFLIPKKRENVGKSLNI